MRSDRARRTMGLKRKALRLGLLAVLLLVTPGCHAPVTITTPQGQAAFKADQVVVRVNELQSAAIKAEAGGGLSTSLTRVIVTFAVGADKTLAAAPDGWQSAVRAAWLDAKKQLLTVTNPAVLAAMGAVDLVLGVMQ